VAFNFAGLRERGISAASLTAIRAFTHVAVGWFDFASTTYQEIEWMSRVKKSFQ
jgi:predicted DNA-binding protein with PD1-like motif